MSRYSKQVEDGKYTVAYGFDHALGYFFQVFDNTIEDEDPVGLVIDECSFMTKMSNGKMIELMQKYEVNQDHIDRVVLDLTF